MSIGYEIIDIRVIDDISKHSGHALHCAEWWVTRLFLGCTSVLPRVDRCPLVIRCCSCFCFNWLLLCLMFPALISKQLFTLFDLKYVWNSFKITRTRNDKIHNNLKLKKQSRWYARCILLSFFLFYFDPSFEDLDYVLQVWVRNISTSCV